MKNVFCKLGPSCYPVDIQLKIIRRNLLPSIQIQLYFYLIRSISDLVTLGKTIEETAWKVQQYAPLPTNYRHLLKPKLVYHKASSGNIN